MNKNFKVFQIHGLSGLFFLFFILTGLVFGFILFPVWAVMKGWNDIIVVEFHMPVINYVQASLLWSIVVLSAYLTFRNSISIKIHTSNDEIDEAEIKQILNEIDETKENTKEE